ncbi:MAG: hypothetical protein L3J93_05710 [Thermoplasmata archaeon]|nr:hypothetical protein [Thermoplasmata archaeon]
MPPRLSIDPGLRERFRAAGAQITWKEADGAAEPAPPKPKGRGKPARPTRQGPDARIAHLNDEDARVEVLDAKESVVIAVDSGPVGALVLLLEIERRGSPCGLAVRDPDPASTFASGALEARWDDGPPDDVYGLPLEDLVQLARYALA